MSAIYLNDWEEGGFIQMVADFEDICITAVEFGAESSPWPNKGEWLEKKEKLSDALRAENWTSIEVLIASYSHGGYEGDAFVLFRKDGKLYEVNAGHCSRYGIEGQWQPEETSVEALRHRLDKGRLGRDNYCGNIFDTELREVLSQIAATHKEGA
ncbi:MAG: hypothetical protein ACKOWC_03890 [Limnohabitans sp.]